MWLISIDPGLVTSGTGIAVFKDNKLVSTHYCKPTGANTLRELYTPIHHTIQDIIIKHAIKDYHIVVEESFFQGKANKLHLKLLGLLQYQYEANMSTIAPLSVKKIVTGSGKSDKKAVQDSLVKLYAHQYYFSKIDWSKNDVVDAVAIGIAWLRRQGLKEVTCVNVINVKKRKRK